MLRPPRSPRARTLVPRHDSRGRSTASPVLSRPLCSNAKTTAHPASYPALVLCEYRSACSFTFDLITFIVESMLSYIWFDYLYWRIHAPLHLILSLLENPCSVAFDLITFTVDSMLCCIWYKNYIYWYCWIPAQLHLILELHLLWNSCSITFNFITFTVESF